MLSAGGSGEHILAPRPGRQVSLLPAALYCLAGLNHAEEYDQEELCRPANGGCGCGVEALGERHGFGGIGSERAAPRQEIKDRRQHGPSAHGVERGHHQSALPKVVPMLEPLPRLLCLLPRLHATNSAPRNFRQARGRGRPHAANGGRPGGAACHPHNPDQTRLQPGRRKRVRPDSS